MSVIQVKILGAAEAILNFKDLTPTFKDFSSKFKNQGVERDYFFLTARRKLNKADRHKSRAPRKQRLTDRQTDGRTVKAAYSRVHSTNNPTF